MRGIHRRPVNSPHKWSVTRKMFPFDDVIMSCRLVAMHCTSRYPKWDIYQANCSTSSISTVSIFCCQQRQNHVGMGYLPSLKKLYAQKCGLDTFPNLWGAPGLKVALLDLYHLPLTTLSLYDNPLLYDQTLCWIPIWDMVEKNNPDVLIHSCSSPDVFWLHIDAYPCIGPALLWR